MPIDVIMPSLGAVAEEATLLHWLVEEGETIEKGQPIFEAESDKATVEVAAPDSGTVNELLAAPGDVVPAGHVVGTLLAPGEKPTDVPEKDHALPSEPAPPAIAGLKPETLKPATLGPATPKPSTGRKLASPVARRLAREQGIDVTTIRGTGPGGRIIKADVEDAVARQRGVPDLTRIANSAVPPSLPGVRGAIARHMARSARTTAPVTLTTEVDAEALVKTRQMLRAEAGAQAEEISYTLLMAFIAARALTRHPELNASLTEDGIVRHPEVNVGIAVDTERGLLVPVLRGAAHRSLLDLAADLQAKVARALEGKAMPEDLSGGTFTITNLGPYGVDSFTPIINLPECAILGIGRIRTQPVVRQGALAPGQTMALSLTFDHRLVDGAPAARFLQHVTRLVERPTLLLLH